MRTMKGHWTKMSYGEYSASQAIDGRMDEAVDHVDAIQ